MCCHIRNFQNFRGTTRWGPQKQPKMCSPTLVVPRIGIPMNIIEDTQENLFSVCLITNNGYYVLFTRNEVLIINEITLQIVASGHKRKTSNLYYINMLDVINLPILTQSQELKYHQSPTQSNSAFRSLQSRLNSIDATEINDDFEYSSDDETRHQITYTTTQRMPN